MANSLNAKTVQSVFFGGEPLMNFPLIQPVVVYATERAAKRGREVKFSMTTNGSRLTKRIIDFIKEQKISPLISFDGPPEVQDRQRPFKNGRGSYNRVAANVRKLRASTG